MGEADDRYLRVRLEDLLAAGRPVKSQEENCRHHLLCRPVRTDGLIRAQAQA